MALCVIAATIITLAFNVYLSVENGLVSVYSRADIVPQHAHHILKRCAAQKASPGPHANFLIREVSDRFETGTKPTLIRNATIWSGGRNGTEVIFGDLLLDGGIVKGMGEIPDFRIARIADELTVVDANGSWLTPGLGYTLCLTI